MIGRYGAGKGPARLALLLTLAALPAFACRPSGEAGRRSLLRPYGAAQVRLTVARAAPPLAFESNRGQTDPRVRFLARAPGCRLFLTRDGEAVVKLERQPASATAVTGQGSGAPAVLRIRPLGVSGDLQASGTGALPGRVNFLLGRDPGRWRRGIPTYARVRYRNVYPGIDLVYYGSGRRIEHDWIVAPGADPARIRLAFGGADRVEINARHELVLHAPGGDLIQHAPVVYQEIAGRRQRIACSYELLGGRSTPTHPHAYKPTQVSFHLGPYDRRRSLIIDPVLSFSTFLGGSGNDGAAGIAVDGSGSVYVTGFTSSPDFPTAGTLQPAPAGNQDAFVTKLAPDGSAVEYSTYLGGSLDDQGSAIAVDGAGSAYVAGETHSTDFPTTPGGFLTHQPGTSSGFVAKLDPTGSALVYSTYLGGQRSGDARGIAVDGAGRAFVTGLTASPDFPTTPTAFRSTLDTAWNAYVTVLDPAGARLLYSTYFGGGNLASGAGIALDGSGDAYVCGEFGMGIRVFAAKFDPSQSGAASLVYEKDLDLNDPGGIAVDRAGSAYVAGFAETSPSSRGGFSDAIVTKLDPTGFRTVYTTFLGGRSQEVASGVAVDAEGNAYVAGCTLSPDFPLARPLQRVYGGPRRQPTEAFDAAGDAFVTKLSADGRRLLYSTYLGGSGDDCGRAIAVDSRGNAYVAGVTASPDFPTAAPLQPAFAAGSCQGPDGAGPCTDVFVAKITEDPSAIRGQLAAPSAGVSFRPSRIGVPQQATLQLRNAGLTPLQVTVGVPVAPFSVVSGGGTFAIPPHARHPVALQFTPMQAGSFSARLALTSSDPQRAVLLLKLSGRTGGSRAGPGGWTARAVV